MMLLTLLTGRSLVDKPTMASNQATTNTTPKGGDVVTWGKGVTSKKREECKLFLKHGSKRFEEICELGTKMITQQSDEEHPSIKNKRRQAWALKEQPMSISCQQNNLKN
jgi:hypothetical protein